MKFTWALQFYVKAQCCERISISRANVIGLPEVLQHGDDGEVNLRVFLGRHERPHAVVDGAIFLAAAQERLKRKME